MSYRTPLVGCGGGGGGSSAVVVLGTIAFAAGTVTGSLRSLWAGHRVPSFEPFDAGLSLVTRAPPDSDADRQVVSDSVRTGGSCAPTLSSAPGREGPFVVELDARVRPPGRARATAHPR